MMEDCVHLRCPCLHPGRVGGYTTLSGRICLAFLLHFHLARSASSDGAESGARRAPLDIFEESLRIRSITSGGSPPGLFLARFEFGIATSSRAFDSDHFDLFPKSFGKLLNAHPAITAFEAALTRGRWKEEWGRPPREFHPPGAVVLAAVNSTHRAAAEGAWRFLVSALAGALCASFEGADPARRSSGARPLGVPWAEPGEELRLASLPYEPLCTENLTPWLKLLPCGRHLGLAALLAPLALAESPLVSLALAVAAPPGARGPGRGEPRASLRASLDVVLPLAGGAGSRGLRRFFGGGFESCPAARSSTVLLSGGPEAASQMLRAGAEVLQAPGGAGRAVRLPAERFAALEHGTGGAAPSGEGDPPGSPLPPSPEEEEEEEAHPHAEGVSVMRDVLSREGRSERTHGRYLLRFTNSGPKRRVHFMDQLPFFLQPLWHTLRATFAVQGGQAEELSGLEAMERLQLRFTPSDGERLPTEVFLSVDVPQGGVVGVFLDVAKAFIQLGEFSYACEKGFDVGSAAWLEAEAAEGPGGGPGPVRAGELLGPRGAWRLRLSGGLIVLLPMPDFSMPFNVIALSSTAVTFFFGSLFRLTAAGRQPHWVLKREEAGRGRTLWPRLLLATAAAGLYALSLVDAPQLAELRGALPPAAWPAVELLENAKGVVDKFAR